MGMTEQQESAMRQALEALTLAVRQNSHDMLMTGEELRPCEQAITALTAALEQPAQQEPLTFSKLCEIEEAIADKNGDVSLVKFARAIEAAHGIGENA